MNTHKEDLARELSDALEDNGRAISYVIQALADLDGDTKDLWSDGTRVVVYVDFVDLLHYLKLNSSELALHDPADTSAKSWLSELYFYVLVSVFTSLPVSISIMPWHYAEYRRFVVKQLGRHGIYPGESSAKLARDSEAVGTQIAREVIQKRIPELLSSLRQLRTGGEGSDEILNVKRLARACLTSMATIRTYYGERAQLLWCMRRFEGLRSSGRLHTLKESLPVASFEFVEDDVYRQVLAQFSAERDKELNNEADARSMCCVEQIGPILRNHGKAPILFSSAPIMFTVLNDLRAAMAPRFLHGVSLRDAYYWGAWFACGASEQFERPSRDRARELRELLEPELAKLSNTVHRLTAMMAYRRLRAHDAVTARWLHDARDNLRSAMRELQSVVRPFMEHALSVACARDSVIAAAPDKHALTIDSEIKELQGYLGALESARDPLDVARVARELEARAMRLEGLWNTLQEQLEKAGRTFTVWRPYIWLPSDALLSPQAQEIVQSLELYGAAQATDARRRMERLEDHNEALVVGSFVLVAEGRYEEVQSELQRVDERWSRSPDVAFAQLIRDERALNFELARRRLDDVGRSTEDVLAWDIHRRYVALAKWQLTQLDDDRARAIEANTVAPLSAVTSQDPRSALAIIYYWKARLLAGKVEPPERDAAHAALEALQLSAGDGRRGEFIRMAALGVMQDLIAHR
jgi:hypothetical protein